MRVLLYERFRISASAGHWFRTLRLGDSEPVWRLSSQVTRFTVRRLNLRSSRKRLGSLALHGYVDCNRRKEFLAFERYTLVQGPVIERPSLWRQVQLSQL